MNWTITLSILLGSLASACSDAPKNTVKKGNSNDAMHASPTAAPTTLSRTIYEVRVLPLNAIAGCNGCDPDNPDRVLVLAGGEIVMETMSNFAIKFVSGSVRILNNPALTIDLSKSLSQFAPDATKDTMSGNISSDLDGKVVMTKRIGNMLFEPARPLILGPIIQDPSDFAGIDKTYPGIRFMSAPEYTGPAVAGTATIRLKVINPRETYKPRHPAISATPFEVLHWEMSLDNSTATTSQNVQALLLNRIAFYWRTRPIQIPRLALDTDLASLLGGRADAGLAALGGVRVILDAKEITSF